jgi:NTE family protein
MVQPDDLVGVVLSGAGARGAYEAGDVAELLPELEDHGIRPRVYVGSSAGAINAVALAQFADLPATRAVEELLTFWRTLTHRSVWASVAKTAPRLAMRYVRGSPVTSLLDTRPTAKTAERSFDADRLHGNVVSGLVDAAAVVARLCPSGTSGGRTRVFVASANGQLPRTDERSNIEFVQTELGVLHILASNAIPVLFPRFSSPSLRRRRAGISTAAYG